MSRSCRFAVLTLVCFSSALGVVGCLNSSDSGHSSDNMTREPVAMEKLNYPASKTIDQVDDYHGTSVADPYRWLEDVDSDETHAWVEAQNQVACGFLESIPEREIYEKRLTDLWNYERYGTPYKKGGRTFFSKNDGLQNQSVIYVQDTPDAEPRVLIDPNTLSEDGTIALGGASISKNGKYLAWATTVSGSDWRTWRVRDIATSRDLEDEVRWSKFSNAAWDKNAAGFYYSRYESPEDGETFEGANYYQKLYYHEVGTPQSADRLVYDRPDQKEWGFSGSVSDDGRYLLISVWQGSNRNNRLYYKDLTDGSDSIVKLLNDYDAGYNFIGNDGPVFFIKTNLDAPRERIIAIDTRHPDKENWRTLIPETADPIDGVSILNHSFVVITMHDVVSVVKIYGMDGEFKTEVPMPGLGSVGGFHGYPEDTETYFSFTSFLSPDETYHYDFQNGESTLFRAPKIDFDFDAYETEQVFYPSRDGTKIPMFLVHKKGLKLDGTNPTLLYAYGGFNVSMNPVFRASNLPWFEQGGVYALANIRGGGEYGEDWHQGGMLKNKQNCFDDFIGAAEHLIAEGYTNPNRLAIVGGSNGGTLVGAVVNQRPELFGAAIPQVGVMDMLRFQLFTIGWAWTSDYGSSEDPDLFPVLYSYSPYHNLKAGIEYPSIMITTADHDDRVVPGHSFKYAAKLQACQAGNLPVMIRVQTKAGHSAGRPTAMIIQVGADKYAFLHRALRMDPIQ
jgi:prolyl oligopeptidase